MDAPSVQLNLEVRDAVVRALATRRPILHHLNADTSWLLQVPRPASAVRHGSRVYYNVLIDPWFAGGQSDVARWFSQQWHATESAVQTMADVDQLARQVEILAGGWRHTGEALETYVDAVAISHEFTDHCHRETLLEVHPDVPVLATEQAARLISSWQHFRTVLTTPAFDDNADWHDYSLAPLPAWLSITRLTAPGDALYYHSALIIAFATHPLLAPATPRKRSSLSINGHGTEDVSTAMAPEAAECVIYTPHGIPYTALNPIATADPPLQTLAFLHGLHDVSISAAQQLNLGARNGVLAQGILKAKYWVATHDEVKKGGGLISWFLNRKIWTVDEALKAVSQGMYMGYGNPYGHSNQFEDVRFQDMGNGESRVLE